MRRSLNVSHTQGVLVYEGTLYTLESFVDRFKLFIDYMVCEQFLNGRLIVWFYDPKNNRKFTKKKSPPSHVISVQRNGDWKLAKVTKIYLNG